MPGKLRVTQVKSTISHIARNRATVRALGLRGIGSTIEVVDNEATRGMVRQVRFLVTVEEVTEAGSDPGAAPSRSGRRLREHPIDAAPSVRKRGRTDAGAGVGPDSGGATKENE